MNIILGAFQFGIEFNKTTKREEIVRLLTSILALLKMVVHRHITIREVTILT